MASNNKAGFNGISVASSMFACLPCDEEAEVKKKNRGGKKKEDEEKPKQKKNDNNNSSAQQKNKNKNSLQSAATLSNKSKKKSQTPQPAPQRTSSPPKTHTSVSESASSASADPQWMQWQERDQENVDADYEKALQEAIEISKKEAKEMESIRKAMAVADLTAPSAPSSASSSGVTKKKKKKSNSESKTEKTVHLSTFLNENSNTPATPTPIADGADSTTDPEERLAPTGDDEETIVIAPRIATLTARPKTYEVDADDSMLTSADAEDDFHLAGRAKDGSKERELRREKEAEERELLRQIQQDVNKIIRKEECTEFIKQNEQLISDAVRCAQYRDEIDQKNDAIKELQLELETMKEEFAKVKKRNKQLAFIISQGEMQEKADLLTEIDELKEVKDELTTQTAQLQQELEQERTKTHKMAKELQTLKGHKGGKHSSPSTSEN